MAQKIKTLITMIPPISPVKEVLCEIEPFADIHFLAENEKVADHIEDIEVFYGNIEEDDFVIAKKLKWVQTNSTGVEHVMYPAFKKSEVLLTHAGRSITTVVADHAMALFLALARNLHHQRDLMIKHKWEIVTGRDIGNMVLGILGYGNIGKEIARRARSFVKAIYVLDIQEIAPGETIDKSFTLEDLHAFLGECDAVICSLPLTPDSMKLISDEEFELMKDNGYLINISRGGIVDEKALLKALRSKKIAGAATDVLETEPCPADSPLWGEPNLLLTPHSAGFCENLYERKIRQFVENFKHYAKDGKIPMSLNKAQGW